MYLRLALGQSAVDAFRLRLGAAYSCRAIADLMLTAAQMGEVKDLTDRNENKNRADMEHRIRPLLPFYDLLERVRIHDFHRFGIMPPDPGRQTLMLGGRIKLTAQKGIAAVSIAGGLKTTKTGASSVKLQRPLLNVDGHFFDDALGSYVALEYVIDEFLRAVPAAIEQFERWSS